MLVRRGNGGVEMGGFVLFDFGGDVSDLVFSWEGILFYLADTSAHFSDFRLSKRSRRLLQVKIIACS